MEFEFWKLSCLLNIIILSYGLYKILYSSEADAKKTLGCKNCYSVKLITSIYLSIVILSSYCLIYNDRNVARGLLLVQIIYKIIMFAIFEAYAINMMTIANLMMILFLAFTLYIGV